MGFRLIWPIRALETASASVEAQTHDHPLFADAQGYSALMASNEAATLERLNRYRAIMSALFVRHEGRQVNTWGDAVITEFASVVEAVRCAVEIQDSLGAENRGLPKSQQMWFRIGINLGDVMVDGNDLYGDGVNVAQRLEALAEPGGILVSGVGYRNSSLNR